MPLSPGDRVDRYVLEAALGEGGQGQVWRARDLHEGNAIRALKLVQVDAATSAELERLRREARQLVQLRHPSLIECFSLFEDLHRGLLGIVMEFVEGQSLAELVSDARLDDESRLSVLAHIANALAYVHQRNVVHRDVKLENALVTRAFWQNPANPASVRLIDFGIAVPAANPSPLTQVGHVIGTVAYMAPEQLEPELWGATPGASAAADVFAFGILAWKLLARDAESHPTGLSPSASLAAYAAAYRRAQREPWPKGAPTAQRTGFFERTLALHARTRPRSGLELVSMLSSAEASSSAPPQLPAGTAPMTGSRGGLVPESTRGETELAEQGKLTPETIPGLPLVLGSGALPPGPIPPAPPRPTPRRASSVLLVGLVVVGLCVPIVVLAVFGPKRPEHREAILEAPKSAQPLVSISAEPTPTPTAPPDVRDTVERRTRPVGCAEDEPLCDCCRPGQRCCSSGRDCAGSCDDLLQPGEPFLLRLSGVRSAPTEDLYSTRPNGEVCVAVAGNRKVCTKLADVRSKLAPKESLFVTTEDLVVHGLDISVRDGSGSAERRAAKHGSIKRSAICRGLVFRGGFDGGDLVVDSVEFFLDDPDAGRPMRCVGADAQGQSGSVRAQPAPGGTEARALDPTTASHPVPIINALAGQHAPGARRVGSLLVGDFRAGQRLEQQVQMNPGKCYTAVAAGLPAVAEVNLRFVSVVATPMTPKLLAEDTDQGPQAVLGSKPNCWKNALPMAMPVKLVLEVARGSGIAAAQLYEK